MLLLAILGYYALIGLLIGMGIIVWAVNKIGWDYIISSFRLEFTKDTFVSRLSEKNIKTLLILGITGVSVVIWPMLFYKMMRG